ncbi:MAG: hypothetical protein K6G75_02890 [Lachnospiraceae bacterium]|nr:hypothetical protein [Lachnospiraceae bacterium]
MPKVSEEYFENKRKFIVDSVYRVCLRKPVEMVTMTDVIEETGLSQGGIYRFYKDLDDILADMITGMRKDYSFISRVEESLAKAENKSFEKTVHEICNILADVMEEHLMDIQKINFDLTVLAINKPERAEKIIGKTRGRGNFEYLATKVLPMFAEASTNNTLKPQCNPENIMRFISASYVGIEADCILSACYGKAPMNTKCEPHAMFDTLATAIILLFGGKENE